MLYGPPGATGKILLDIRHLLALQLPGMAYLRIKRIKKGRYLYIQKSERKGGRMTTTILEYLGNADKVDPKRLKRALAYWGVKSSRPGKGGRS